MASAAPRRTGRGGAFGLALGVLRAAPGFAPPDLLALDFAGIAGDEARLTQGLAQCRIVLHQRPGNAVANRTGLAGDSATADLHLDVEFPGELHQFERLAHDHAAALASEELIDGPVVDGDAPGARLQVHAGRRSLAPAGAVVGGGCHVWILKL